MSEKPKVTPRQQSQRPPRVRLDSLKNPQPRPIPKARNTPRPAQAQAHRTAVVSCTNKACTKSDVRDEDGQKICHECGTVVDESQITSEVTFGETSSGAAAVQGSYVGADQSHARNNALGGSKITGGMDSREITEANGRRYINQLAAALQIATPYVDSAMQVYKLAYGINFIQGRQTKYVAAVCLYIACRRSKESRIMLIDFADILMVNVFKLGQVFNSLVEDLGLRKLTVEQGGIDLVNPEALILRFASRLEFGDKTHHVATEAARVLQRMDRDWMATGRRPAGICGAALILAARMNNFRRTVREVVYIVKVNEVTIQKRLEEFKRTESSTLTVAEFRHHGVDLEHSSDPPAFYEQFETKKKRRKRKAGELEDDFPSGDEESGPAVTARPANANPQLSTPANTQQAQTDSQAMPPPPIPIDPALLHISAQRLLEIQSSQTPEASGSTRSFSGPPNKRKRGRPAGIKKKQPPAPSASQLLDEQNIESDIASILDDPTAVAHASGLHRDGVSTEPESLPKTHQERSANITYDNDNSILESTETTSVSSTPQTQPQVSNPPRTPIPDTEIIPEEEFADDPEVENCLLTPAEVEIKERIWVHENGDYLRAQQAKMLKQQLAEENGTARKIVRRKRRRGRMGDMTPYQTISEDGLVVPQSPLEAMKKMMKVRGYGLSSKLNYQKLEELYPDLMSSNNAISSATSSTGNTGSEAGTRAGTPLVTITSPTPPGSGERRAASTITETARAGTEGNEASPADDAISNADDYVDEFANNIGAIVHDLEDEEEDLEDDYVGNGDEGVEDVDDEGFGSEEDE